MNEDWKLSANRIKKRRREIGVQLKSLRQRHNLSQTAIAEIMGCSRTRISGIEQGKSTLDIAELEALAEHFSIPLPIMLGWKLRVIWSLPDQEGCFDTAMPLNSGDNTNGFYTG